MITRIFAVVLTMILAGCATAPNGDTPNQGANSVYNDPTYPGAGARIGIGGGTWGGRSGGGIGIGLGW